MSFETWRTQLHPGQRFPTLASTDIWGRQTLFPMSPAIIRETLADMRWRADRAAHMVDELARRKGGRVTHEIPLSEAFDMARRKADANSYAWQIVGNVRELERSGLLQRLDAFFAPLPDAQLADYHNARTEVRWDEADKIYVARSLEFPSVAAHGSSIWEAERQLRVALDAVRDDLEKL